MPEKSCEFSKCLCQEYLCNSNRCLATNFKCLAKLKKPSRIKSLGSGVFEMGRSHHWKQHYNVPEKSCEFSKCLCREHLCNSTCSIRCLATNFKCLAKLINLPEYGVLLDDSCQLLVFT